MQHLISNYKRHNKRRTKRRVGLEELQRVIALLLGHPFPETNDLYVIPEDENQAYEDDIQAKIIVKGREAGSRSETAHSRRSNATFLSSDIPDEASMPAPSRDSHRTGGSVLRDQTQGDKKRGEVGKTRPKGMEMDRIEVEDTRPVFGHFGSSFLQEGKAIKPGKDTVLRSKLRPNVRGSYSDKKALSTNERPYRGSSDSPTPMLERRRGNAAEMLAEYGVNLSQDSINPAQMKRSYRSPKLQALKQAPDLPKVAPISLAEIMSKTKAKKQALAPLQGSPSKS